MDIPIITKRNSRARRISIKISSLGEVTLILPKRTPLWLGKKFLASKLSWVRQSLEKIKTHNKDKIILRSDANNFNSQKNNLLIHIKNKIEIFNKHYRFKIGEVRIKNNGSRWGSCSAKGNLNFNYKMSYLPENLSDYIIVHELCHIGEFNHSKKFFALVAQSLPDWKERRGELRKKYLSIKR